jgi:uncharacterized protein YndB with AHSA1/START domain
MDRSVQRSNRAEVTVEAPIEAVWRVVVDVRRTGEWSHIELLDGATSVGVGVRFVGGNRLGWSRWSRTNEVTELEAGRRIGWRTLPTWRFPDSTEWPHSHARTRSSSVRARS